MKTDIPFGKLFRENPEMLTELMSVDTRLDFKVAPEEFKDVKRTADLVWYHEQSEEVRIIEIQGYRDPLIFHRGELERTLYSMRHPEKKVMLVIIFLDPSFQPHSEPWTRHLANGDPLYEVLYLEEQLTLLAERQPDHPLLSVLKPVTVEDEEQLRVEASVYHRLLRERDLPEPSKTNLLEVFEALLMSRFRSKNLQELRKMLAPIGKLSDSVAYREIFAEGESKGKREGRQEGIQEGIREGKQEGRQEGKREGKLEGLAIGEVKGRLLQLDELLREGTIDLRYYQKATEPLRRRLIELEREQGN